MVKHAFRWLIPLALVVVVALVFVFAPAVLTHAAGMNPH